MNRLITPATALAVTLEAARNNLRIDADMTHLDVLVEAWIRGITAHAEHYMNRSIMRQVRRVTLDRFPSAIRLDNSPLILVEHVKFYDQDNIWQMLDPADYEADSVSEPSYLLPGSGKSWPATYGRVNAVEVQYACGYGVDAASTPDAIRLYILAKLVEMFDPASANAPPTVGKPYKVSFIDSMLDVHKVY